MDDQVYCSYINREIDEGYCYDLQMICNGYIKPSALPESSIDKERLNECCLQCKYHFDRSDSACC